MFLVLELSVNFWISLYRNFRSI